MLGHRHRRLIPAACDTTIAAERGARVETTGYRARLPERSEAEQLDVCAGSKSADMIRGSGIVQGLRVLCASATYLKRSPPARGSTLGTLPLSHSPDASRLDLSKRASSHRNRIEDEFARSFKQLTAWGQLTIIQRFSGNPESRLGKARKVQCSDPCTSW